MGSGRVSAKRRPQQVTGIAPVSSVVKREQQKRHESPRSRRQLINNLAQNSQAARKNQLLSGTTGMPQGANQGFNAVGNATADLTFFDSKMFANNKSKSQANRIGAPKFTTNSLMSGGSTDQAPQFFNKTGPVKIPHSKVMTNPNASTHSAQAEDMMAGTNASTDDALVRTRPGLSATQKINTRDLDNKLDGSSRGKQ